MAVCAEIALAQQIFLLQSPDVPGDKAALKAALQAELFAQGLLHVTLTAANPCLSP